MTDNWRIVDLRDNPDDAFIRDLYREILVPAFKEDELDEVHVILEGLQSPDETTFGLAAVQDDRVAGCVLAYPFRESQVLLVGYLATRPELRSRGIGRMLLAECRDRCFNGSGLTLALAEVDDPRHHPGRENDPDRRIAFYQNQGALMVEGPYMQPAIREYTERVPHMLLTVLFEDDEMATSDARSVSGLQISRFLSEYFADAENDGVEPDDGKYRWLVAWYAAREHVPIRPIAAYQDVVLPEFP